MAAMDAEDWRRRATVTIPEYARIVGVSRSTAYAAARAGEVDVIRQRGRILVCVAPLVRRLALAEAEDGKSEAPGSDLAPPAAEPGVGASEMALIASTLERVVSVCERLLSRAAASTLGRDGP
jgi:hypothetical protein